MSDVAGSRIIDRRNQRVSSFALFLRMPSFAAVCCTERARKGQRHRSQEDVDRNLGHYGLRRLLTRDSRVELLDACAGGAEALEVLRAAAQGGTPVQLMFLDVQVPELDGFGVLAALVRDSPPVPMPEVAMNSP